ncbi:hypothetical protein AB1Y20_015312 [Prymnesium parvum]|uniref:WW domain-containing protein n=1 Tax=Prymnesium parvum TaxID=97485 RepID=A0AB34K0H1_PRYPA
MAFGHAHPHHPTSASAPWERDPDPLLDNPEQTPPALPSASPPSPWRPARDPATGQLYFYNQATGMTSWEAPALARYSEWAAEIDRSSGDTYYYNRLTGETTWEAPNDTYRTNRLTGASTWEAPNDTYCNNRLTGASTWEAPSVERSRLPAGWEMVEKGSTVYYYHTATRATQWHRPQSPEAHLPDAASALMRDAQLDDANDAQLEASNDESVAEPPWTFGSEPLFDETELEGGRAVEYVLQQLRFHSLDERQLQLCLEAILRHIDTADATVSKDLCLQARKRLVDGDGLVLLPYALRAHEQSSHLLSLGFHTLRLMVIGKKACIETCMQHGIAVLVIAAMERHRAVATLQARGCELLKTLAWVHQSSLTLQQAGAVGAVVEALRNFPQDRNVVGESCKALENLCRNQDEAAIKCRLEAAQADVLRMLLKTLHGNLQSLIPYNLVHELYKMEQLLHGGRDMLTFDELRRLQAWYCKIIHNPNKSHV